MEMRIQRGVGLVEVLVALVVLSIAVLGFVALQIRGVAASEEAGKNVQAINLARDLSERMRMNRNGLLSYQKNTDTTNCVEIFCTPTNMAKYDFRQVYTRAQALGMDLDVVDCQGMKPEFKRKCIYVAWGETVAADVSSLPEGKTVENACTDGASYVNGANCVIVEVYNYE